MTVLLKKIKDSRHPLSIYAERIIEGIENNVVTNEKIAKEWKPVNDQLLTMLDKDEESALMAIILGFNATVEEMKETPKNIPMKGE